ncbi:MAG: DUF2147 domain-containing protein [Candidatus Kapabacteria bacterium]|nr:DUF2147 domain-containing protein [Candidatus Kapabacteria bacterium]
MKFNVLFFALICFAAMSLAAQNSDLIIGKWKTNDGTAQIQIYKAANGTFQGKIIVAKPKDPKAAMVDEKNPNPSLRNQPIIGLVLLRDFRFDGEIWKDGNIYDPNNGKDYSCKMWLENTNTLSIRGYIGFSLFGRTETWTRVN